MCSKPKIPEPAAPPAPPPPPAPFVAGGKEDALTPDGKKRKRAGRNELRIDREIGVNVPKE
jgi:hypothetical protein